MLSRHDEDRGHPRCPAWRPNTEAVSDEKPESSARPDGSIAGRDARGGATEPPRRGPGCRGQTARPAGEPPPKDVVSEISRAEGNSVTGSVTIVTPDGQPHVVTLEAGADGESPRISSDTTASVRLPGSGLQTTFNGPAGRSDVQTCTVSADHQKMTCKGVVSDGAGHTASYVDVYDRM